VAGERTRIVGYAGRDDCANGSWTNGLDQAGPNQEGGYSLIVATTVECRYAEYAGVPASSRNTEERRVSWRRRNGKT
jgi:hypothetical protein